MRLLIPPFSAPSDVLCVNDPQKPVRFPNVVVVIEVVFTNLALTGKPPWMTSLSASCISLLVMQRPHVCCLNPWSFWLVTMGLSFTAFHFPWIQTLFPLINTLCPHHVNKWSQHDQHVFFQGKIKTKHVPLLSLKHLKTHQMGECSPPICRRCLAIWSFAKAHYVGTWGL